MFTSFLFSVALLALPPGIDPAVFPDIASRAPSEIELAGLAQLYPGRVLHEAPHGLYPGNAGRAPFVADVQHNVTYVRVYDLAAALPKLAELLGKPALIVDLRYVYGDVAAAEVFARALAKAGLASAPVLAVGSLKAPEPLPEASANHQAPLVLVLVNGLTCGPLEAWLAAFQEKESVLAVGTPTAGQPGIYQPAEGAPGYFIMAGELQLAAGSIAGGGLKPHFPVDATPEQNYVAYFGLERGLDLASLLRHEQTPTAPAPVSANATTTPPARNPAQTAPAEELTDAVLQRAVDVVAALQLLGRVPSSTVTGTGNAPAARPATTQH